MTHQEQCRAAAKELAHIYLSDGQYQDAITAIIAEHTYPKELVEACETIIRAERVADEEGNYQLLVEATDKARTALAAYPEPEEVSDESP